MNARVEHFPGYSAPDREPPEPGYLLAELGYVDELEAAAGLDITPKTLIGYRRAGIGPRHTELARKIFYSREAIAAWLANGGVREP
jgi:Helix-turn-helix domain